MRQKKSLGQNFLHNSDILFKIVDNGDIKSTDTILEIGPGTGNLTRQLLIKKPKKLIVIEKDSILCEKLNKEYGNKIQIINDDILNYFEKIKIDFPLKVFGNLPYNISTKILTKIIKFDKADKIFKKLIFVFQKEVADRIAAKENTKNYGRLSIITYWKFNSEKIFDINPIYFNPKPKVWSSLIILTPKKNIEILKKNKNLEHVTNIFFNQRRKMIKKPMKQLFDNYEIVAKSLEIDLKLRPQNISKKKYIEICKVYENLK